jgi:hypothetical protein
LEEIKQERSWVQSRLENKVKDESKREGKIIVKKTHRISGNNGRTSTTT